MFLQILTFSHCQTCKFVFRFVNIFIKKGLSRLSWVLNILAGTWKHREDIWFGKMNDKTVKLIMMTFAYRYTSYSVYAKGYELFKCKYVSFYVSINPKLFVRLKHLYHENLDILQKITGHGIASLALPVHLLIASFHCTVHVYRDLR